MKNTTLAIGFLLLGLALGYLIFGRSQHSHESHAKMDKGATVTTWTCSMHPQIQAQEPGLCPICEMDLVPLEETKNTDPAILEMTEAAIQLSNIQTQVVGVGAISNQKLELSGKIKADERRIATQVSHISGRIEQLFVSFTGEKIQKGQKLATIYSPELITAQRELLEAIKFQHMNPNLVKASRKKLSYWKISEQLIDEIIRNNSIRETVPIFADYSGIIKERNIAVGDYVQSGQILFEVLNLDKVWAVFDAYEEQVASISLGNIIQFTSPGIPNQVFQTKVNFIDPMIDPQTRVAAIRGEVLNSKGLLRPELFIRGTLERRKSRSESLSVPKSAVLWTGKRSVVYVKVPDRTIPSFEYREVELGEALEETYVIKSGLEAGEEVVVNGSFTIDAAAQLNNQSSMMNKLVQVKKEGFEAKPDFQATTPVVFKTELAAVVVAYLELKTALVETDPAMATAFAQKLKESLSGVKTALEGEPAQVWEGLKVSLQDKTNKLVRTDDVEEQREHFSTISELLIEAVSTFGVENLDLYVQYCPMAFDDTGADWISDSEAIRNPYFGDRMLKCGVVEEQLSKAD